MTSAVFLDRDGVINHNRADYVKAWEEFVFLPGVVEAMRRLAETNLRIIVVTNQSAVNRGLVSLQVVQDICSRMVEEIRAKGGRIDSVLICPHRPDENCDCRKPLPGLLFQAASQFQLDLSQSYLIGDAMSDVAAGLAAGCRVAMVKTGLWNRHNTTEDSMPVSIFRDLSEAVAWVIEQERDS